jgi:hypothetical protein
MGEERSDRVSGVETALTRLTLQRRAIANLDYEKNNKLPQLCAVDRVVRYALCPMPYALCPMPYALCPMPDSTSCY